MSFARYKGVVENKLADMGLGGFSSFRPGYIHPVVAREEPNFTYRFSRAIWPVLGKLFPKMGIDSDKLAQAMLDGALSGDLPEVLENTDILARVA